MLALLRCLRCRQLQAVRASRQCLAWQLWLGLCSGPAQATHLQLGEGWDQLHGFLHICQHAESHLESQALRGTCRPYLHLRADEVPLVLTVDDHTWDFTSQFGRLPSHPADRWVRA